MEEKKKGFVAWVKAHRKQLILAGISVTAILAIIVGLKNKRAVLDLWNSLKDIITKVPTKMPEDISAAQIANSALEEAASVRPYNSPKEAFDVSQHIRNLSGGKHHSAEKAAEAAVLGIFLLPNQTLVDTYKKCAA